ncbi:hypothetical protein D3C76_1747950 [compost metagenome]
MQQLAPGHTVVVEDEQFEQFDIGVLGKERLGVLHGCERNLGKAHGKARISMSDGRQGAVSLCSPLREHRE